jgi:hypothetical protein
VRAVIAAGAIAVTVLAALGIWQVSNDNVEDAPPLAPPPETADPLPELPRGWSKAANGEAGFAVGVPPGWSVKTAAGRTTLKSPGSAAVVAITADRSEAAINTDLQGYAVSTAAGNKDGQGIEAIVVRRPELAAYPVLVVSGPGVKAAELEPIVNRIVSTLRGRPDVPSAPQ